MSNVKFKFFISKSIRVKKNLMNDFQRSLQIDDFVVGRNTETPPIEPSHSVGLRLLIAIKVLVEYFFKVCYFIITPLYGLNSRV